MLEAAGQKVPETWSELREVAKAPRISVGRYGLVSAVKNEEGTFSLFLVHLCRRQTGNSTVKAVWKR